MKRCRLLILLLFGMVIIGHAQTIDDIMYDIYGQLSETQDVDYEDLVSDLMDLASNPINLNDATQDELARLRFLSDAQIDALLSYVAKHPLAEIYELKLIPGFRDYDIRNLTYFVTVEPVEKNDKMYFREVFHDAKHEITLRTDARDIEHYKTDPIYAQLRYRFNYKNRVQMGINLKRNPSSLFRDLDYGTYLQLNNIGHLKTLVAGNYQGQYGMGLVLGNPFHMSKSIYLTSCGTEGIKKFSSASPSYDYLHGAAATVRYGEVDVTALYSLRQDKDSNWHHVVGVNTTWTHNRLRLGLTALENIYMLPDRDSTQACFGIYARYNWGRVDLSSEIATSQGLCWGLASSLMARFTPIDGLGLIALYRYYSPSYTNRYAYGFAEKSKTTDENGLYLGLDVNMLRQWRFLFYADGYRQVNRKNDVDNPSWGYDLQFQAHYFTTSEISMNWRLRARMKQDIYTNSLRYQLLYESAGWKLKTQLDANMTNDWNWGASVLQDIQYTFAWKRPLTLQLRLQAFDIRNWANRIYVYENDVLYAFSIPAVYGQGGRVYLNMRWKICKQLSLYLRASETLTMTSNRTDIHLLMRAYL